VGLKFNKKNLGRKNRSKVEGEQLRNKKPLKPKGKGFLGKAQGSLLREKKGEGKTARLTPQPRGKSLQKKSRGM